MQGFDVKDTFTMSVAAVGAVLGVINTVQSLNQQRVKLRVTPKMAHLVFNNGELGEEMGCIEVINLSTFPVGIQEIGFTMSASVNKGKRVVIPSPLTMDQKPFVRRLEPRQSVAGYFQLNGLPGKITRAYARTDCDEIVYGVSPALRSLQKRMDQ